MNDARYRHVIEAFRKENPGSALDAEAIRRRLLLSLARKPVRNRRSFGWVLPFAAVLAASAALAATGHLAVPRAMRPRAWFAATRLSADSAANGASVAEAPAQPARLGASTSDEPAAALGSPSTTAPTLAAPAIAKPARDRQPAARTRPVRAAEDRTEHASSAPDPALENEVTSPDELELFRAARRLHAQGSDPVGALAAWDTYLQRFPSGKLAVEARFNRALCLIKAGRTAEAQQALAPFASGAFGAYRRTDARTLLRLLDPSP